MFFKRAKVNPFIARMENYEKSALERCSAEMVPMVIAFFEKSRKANIEWDGRNVNWYIEKISEIVMNLARNTHAKETIFGTDMESMENIFIELESLYAEALEHSDISTDTRDVISDKIRCIDEIVCKNRVDNIHGKIFQNYASLYEIIHVINTQYSELVVRGFSSSTFNDFWESFKYNKIRETEKSESEKLALLKGLLDGTMKFHPQYEYRAVAYQIVPLDFDEILNTNIDSGHSKGYNLKSKEQK